MLSTSAHPLPGGLASREVTLPWGIIVVVASARGLVTVGLPGCDRGALLRHLSHRFCQGEGDLTADSAVLEEAAQQLRDYAAGTRQHFDLPLDWGPQEGVFSHKVHQFLPTIPYGSTMSYGDVAAALGNPGAARAVGTACRTNPLPIIVPCHRVIRADGTWGNYAGGAAEMNHLKGALLTLERGSGR